MMKTNDFYAFTFVYNHFAQDEEMSITYIIMVNVTHMINDKLHLVRYVNNCLV